MAIIEKNPEKNPNKRKLVSDTKGGPKIKHIGETSRSVFERGGEHQKDLEFRRPKSHILRHCVMKHPENGSR